MANEFIGTYLSNLSNETVKPQDKDEKNELLDQLQLSQIDLCYNLPMHELKMERRGQLKDMDRSFDYAYWQRQTARAKFDATWELIVHAYRVKGHDVRQLRLQRSVENFQSQ